ncbi:putative C6 finger domain protein [Microdochium bolleyi]|uniref:Putative C6 finger domain protein n=1 Tax=Microdochium bolleyi TaxID=196109 RepID=A0A136IYW8_9PEZI|nr:putative C6 finger domain protein [Microdochium bolleyi]
MADTPARRAREDDDSDPAGAQSDGPNKKPRIFVARQACERCRVKKTRCDEDFPCSLCKALGLECKYADRKATRNEASFSTVLSYLARIESKVEQISNKPVQTPAETWHGIDTVASPGQTGPITPRGLVTAYGAEDATRRAHSHHHIPYRRSLPVFPRPSESPAALGTTPETVSDTVSHPPQTTPISFSAHKVLQWPAVAALMPPEVAVICREHGTGYVSVLEGKRPNVPLPGSLSRQSLDYGSLSSRTGVGEEPSLSRLSVSVITTLCDAYFTTFHLAHPILDRGVFSHHTLSVAIQRGFDYDIESCVVLTVMALGCWGIRASREAGFAASTPRTTHYLDDPSLEQYLGHGGRDGIPGLTFFNEARKRVGFLRNENGMQNCQFHLLNGLFYAQLVRPMDWYACIGRAAICCITFWECHAADCDDWARDMQSRLFWITVMAESVLADELSLPTSRLAQLQEKVPLPKFVKLERNPFLPVVEHHHDYSMTASGGKVSSHKEDEQAEADDLFYNYHFLSQIAHRILLTRMKDSLYYSSPTGNYPPATLEDELNHQHQQWRSQLPPALHFTEEEAIPPQASPRDILVVAWLRSRFVVAKIHLARPFLHKVLSRPDLRTPEDIARCREIFKDFLQWGAVLEVILLMKNCLPLRFSLAAQLFGQLLILYAFRNNEDASLAASLPPGYQSWCTFVVNMLEDCAPLSPAIARDAQIAAVLYPRLVEPGLGNPVGS